MSDTARCHTKSTLAALALIAVLASSPAWAQTHELAHWIGIVGLAEVQSLRICIGSAEARGELVIPVAWHVIHAAGSRVLEGELNVPSGEFRCNDISHAELVAAGLPPDPSTRAITFRVDILHPRGGADKAGSNKTRTGAAVMSVNVDTGKAETFYHGWIELNSVTQTVTR